MGLIKILLMGDSHLGFDLPIKPRIKRRRRGLDFYNNYLTALQIARENQVDLVVHGGDILYRAKVKPELVKQAFEPLKRLATSGIPIYLVPGNHERSRIPHRGLAEHPLIFIFDEPGTFVFEKKGIKVALAGFPCLRKAIRINFEKLVEATAYRKKKADCNILCVHQAFDGARVGVQDYIFRYQQDVIDHKDVPIDLDAIFSGHIHRQQSLFTDLKRQVLSTPVFYPGSLERTSFAEREESKGVVLIQLDVPEKQHSSQKKVSIKSSFIELYARPMVQTTIDLNDWNSQELKKRLPVFFAKLPSDSIVRIRIKSAGTSELQEILSAPNLRNHAPETMNVSTVWLEYQRKDGRAHRPILL